MQAPAELTEHVVDFCKNLRVASEKKIAPADADRGHGETGIVAAVDDGNEALCTAKKFFEIGDTCVGCRTRRRQQHRLDVQPCGNGTGQPDLFGMVDDDRASLWVKHI